MLLSNQALKSSLGSWANSAAPIHYGDNEAHYIPAFDVIHLPDITAFKSMQDYYATALHEIAHSTGHESRLDRNLADRSRAESAREELRAELASMFIQAELGLFHHFGQYAQ